MACLIYQSNSEGCTGKCDANCYNATGPVCDCVCGGMNHGAGLKQATANTALYAEKMIEKYAEEKGIDKKEFHVNKKIFQLKMFE